MNMDAPIGPVPPVGLSSAYAEVDAWRGRCVRHFAKLEQAIAGFLAEHQVQRPRGGHGLGCRLRDLTAFLEEATSPNDPLRKAVRALEPAKARRDAIVHGDGTIYVSSRGEWLWDCAFTNARDDTRGCEIFRAGEAHAFERQLKAQVQGLCDRLRNYRIA